MGNEGEKLLGGNCRLHGTTDAVDQWFWTTGNSVVRLIVGSLPAARDRRAMSQGHGSTLNIQKCGRRWPQNRLFDCCLKRGKQVAGFINEFLI